MSIETVIHASKPNAIRADAGNTFGGPLHIAVGDYWGGQPAKITIYTGSIALSDALADAINGVMQKFAKPAPAESEAA